MISLAVLGDPVAHSRSPRMHRAALSALGLAGTYEARRVDDDGMRQQARLVRHGALLGANVTMPHKRLAFELCDSVEPEARAAGSVNTWVRRGSTLHGTSTDIAGVRRCVTGRGLGEGPVLVLGAGGAARAAMVALTGRRMYLSARRPEALAAPAELARATLVEWGAGVDGCLVVNCTPIGMRGETLPAPVLDGATGLLDMAYGDGETPAVARFRANGLPHADGIDLLVAQAEASFTAWIGVEPPFGVMERAARNLSRG